MSIKCSSCIECIKDPIDKSSYLCKKYYETIVNIERGGCEDYNGTRDYEDKLNEILRELGVMR